MKGYGQFCPVAQAMEIIGERWTLLVVRELLTGSRRFNDIKRGVPLMSRTMLSQRLKSLEDAGIVRRVDEGKFPCYDLTEAGLELRPIIFGAGQWGLRWARQKPSRENLDAGLLMWDIRRGIHLDRVPEARTTVEFRIRGADRGKGRFWLVTNPDDADLCLHHPGFDVDLKVDTHVRTLTDVWMGDVAIDQAIRSNKLQLDGPRALVRAFPSWLKLNPFAHLERRAAS